MPAHLDVTGLGPLTRLASGGQGEVFAAPRLRMQYASSLVFKHYRQAVAGSLDVSVLESMPAYLESLPFAGGMQLLSQAAWPCRLVDDGGRVAGFVMPAIPDSFFVQMRKSSGMSREAAEFQHLLNDESFLARRQIGLSDRRRYGLLGEVARALSVFHRHAIAVGDLSPKNLLFTYDPDPGVYFIDCDAMRFQGRSVMQQLETPGWEVRAVNPAEELGTAASDSYKLGLLALRLLVGSQDARDPARLPRKVPAAVRQLITAALSADPARRPKPADWAAPLDAAAATASTQMPQLPKTIPTTLITAAPTAAQPLPRPVPRPAPPRGAAVQSRPLVQTGSRSARALGGIAAIAVALIVIIVAIAEHHSSPLPSARVGQPGALTSSQPPASPEASTGQALNRSYYITQPCYLYIGHPRAYNLPSKLVDSGTKITMDYQYVNQYGVTMDRIYTAEYGPGNVNSACVGKAP
jgi:hypothetical protein